MEFWEEGEDWAIGRQADRRPYCTLLGGHGWTFELDGEETRRLLALASQLQAQWQRSLAELMDGESLTCAAGCERIELEITGQAAAFSLRVRVLGGRQVEGIWKAQTGRLVMDALARLARRVAGH